MGGYPHLDPTPPPMDPDFMVGKNEIAKGNIDLGYFWDSNLCVPDPSPQGLALIFIPAGGGGPPVDPLPPSPLSSSAPENLGFGNFFQSWEKHFRRLRRMPYTVYVLLHVCSIYLVLQTTMPQHLLSVYFSSPVQPSPRAKR